MTPAQLAKEYAARYGFIIAPDDKRRYNVLFDGSLVRNVGGYPAALNACPCAPEGDGTNAVCPNPVTGALGCDPLPHTFAAAVAAVVSKPDVLAKFYGLTRNLGECDEALIIRTNGHKEFLNVAYGRVSVLHPEFEDFNEASKARIRAAADKIKRDKASCAVPKPWALFGNGYEIDGFGYVLGRFGSRAEAVTASRQFYNKYLRMGIKMPSCSIRHLEF